MAELVYIACAAMSLLCSALLFRNYFKGRVHLLLWAAFCFLGLTISNMILVVDMLVFPKVDFGGPFWRSLTAAMSGFMLLVGLILELS